MSSEEYLKLVEKYNKEIEDFKKRTLPWTDSTDIKAWVEEERRLLKKRKDAIAKYWEDKGKSRKK